MLLALPAIKRPRRALETHILRERQVDLDLKALGGSGSADPRLLRLIVSDTATPQFIRRYTLRNVIALGLIGGLLVYSTPVQAGPLVDSALQLAKETRFLTVTAQPAAQPSCAAAASAGTTDGRQRQSSVGWFVGGIFLPVIMPIVAHVTTPQPPADTVLQYSGDDARCYSAGYSDAASGKRKKGAWIGSATAIGLWVALVAIAADDLDSRFN